MRAAPVRRQPAVLRVLPALAGLVLVAVGCAGSPGDLPPPSSTALLRVQRSTTTGPDYSGNRLPALEGSTTSSTVPIRGGGITLKGKVTGPEGPVVGATVRIERLVGDDVGSVDVKTGTGGKWSLPDVLAGRLRLRAWRAPDLVQATPTVLFATGEQDIALAVAPFTGISYAWATAPRSPWLGQQAAVAVRIGRKVVGDDGVGRTEPEVGQPLTLTVTGALEPAPVEFRTTDGGGESRWLLRCLTVGPSTLTLTLATGETTTYEAPACVPEPTTTTTPPTLPTIPVPPEVASTVP